jgi:hypothetical protein
MREQEYAKARYELEQELHKAKSSYDMDTAVKVSSTLERIKQEQNNETNAEIKNELETAQSAFVNRNSYWMSDPKMAWLVEETKRLDKELFNAYYDPQKGRLSISYDDLAHKLETRLAAEHPDVVSASGSSRAPSLNRTQTAINRTTATSSSDTKLFSEIMKDDVYKELYNTTRKLIERSGKETYTASQFINKLRKDGDIR